MRPALVLLLAVLWGATAGAQSRWGTTLLQVDLRAGKKTRIDAATGGALDRELDAVLGRAVGTKESFSTRELEQIEGRLRAALRRERPRATPHFIVFVYPGRISPEKLRLLREVFVDIEILLDPCARSVCHDAVARHIELVGRAVGKAEHQTQRYRVVYKNLIMRTMTHFRDREVGEHRVPIVDCIKAGARRGGGQQWLRHRQRSAANFEPLVAKAIARHASRHRVRLVRPPHVSRKGNRANALLTIRADRTRIKTQVVAALAAAAAGFRDNPTSPADVTLEVVAQVPRKGLEVRRFRCLAQPMREHLQRRLSVSALWASYIRETTRQAGATSFSFEDDEAPRRGGREPTQADVVAVLADNFGQLRSCVRAESRRNKRFRKVTVTFRWHPQGRAADISVKEAHLRRTPLAKCLASAVRRMRFPRFDGAPRLVEYPIHLKH